jgi:hypothetical protein
VDRRFLTRGTGTSLLKLQSRLACYLNHVSHVRRVVGWPTISVTTWTLWGVCANTSVALRSGRELFNRNFLLGEVMNG